MTSSESSGRRNKRRRRRRGGQQNSHLGQQHETRTSTASVVDDDPPEAGDAVDIDDLLNDFSDEEHSPDAFDTAAEFLLTAVAADDPVSAADQPQESVLDETAGNQFAELTSELVEKDELIAALTQQLEDAAERLDRLHRNGTDRGPSGSTSNPGFVLPPSNELNEHVGLLVEAWEELDAVTWMQAFDRKLDELTTLVSRKNVDPAPRAQSPAPPVKHPAADSWMGRMEDEKRRAEEAEEAPPSRLAGWEEMKAQLMQSGGEVQADPDSAATEQDPPLTDGVPPTWDLEPPVAVDIEHADRDALVVAVEERDEFISHLIRRLRSAPTGRPERIDWETLNNAPEQLREHLQELEARLEEVLRMEECDLSLERARLARERARLEQLRRDVERRGTGARIPGTSEETDVSQNERRWLRVFGFGRKTDEPDDDLD